MKPDQFASLARELYGNFGWQTAVAELQKVNQSTVYRWSVGKIPIPDEAVANLKRIAAVKIAEVAKLALCQ